MIVRPDPGPRRLGGPPRVVPFGFLPWLLGRGLPLVALVCVLLYVVSLLLVLLARAYLAWGPRP